MNFKKLMLSALVVVSTSLHAQDSIGWGNGSVPGRDPWGTTSPSDPWSNGQQQQNIRDVEVQVNQYFQGQSRLDLIRDAYVRAQLQGQRIREVIITASSEQGNGQVRLLTNGQALEQPQIINRQMTRLTLRVDPFANSVDQTLRALELELRGRIYVEKAVLALVQNNGPVNPGPGFPSQPQQNEVVRQQLNETIRTEGGLNLFRTFNLAGAHQGKSLVRVTVLARSLGGNAQAQLLQNSQSSSAGQWLSSSSSRISFEVGGARIGQEIQALRLYLRGDVLVEEVSLEFGRVSGPVQPQPGLERRIEQVVNQRLYETTGVNLFALMRLDRRHENRIVDSVEITMRGADYGVRLSLCQKIGGQFPTVNCGPASIMSPGAQTIRLASVNFAKLSELDLSVRMGMIDIERIAINLR